MDFIAKLLYLSGRYITKATGETIIKIIQSGIAMQRNASLKYDDAIQVVKPCDSMMDLINEYCQEMNERGEMQFLHVPEKSEKDLKNMKILQATDASDSEASDQFLAPELFQLKKVREPALMLGKNSETLNYHAPEDIYSNLLREISEDAEKETRDEEIQNNVQTVTSSNDNLPKPLMLSIDELNSYTNSEFVNYEDIFDVSPEILQASPKLSQSMPKFLDMPKPHLLERHSQLAYQLDHLAEQENEISPTRFPGVPKPHILNYENQLADALKPDAKNYETRSQITDITTELTSSGDSRKLMPKPQLFKNKLSALGQVNTDLQRVSQTLSGIPKPDLLEQGIPNFDQIHLVDPKLDEFLSTNKPTRFGHVKGKVETFSYISSALSQPLSGIPKPDLLEYRTPNFDQIDLVDPKLEKFSTRFGYDKGKAETSSCRSSTLVKPQVLCYDSPTQNQSVPKDIPSISRPAFLNYCQTNSSQMHIKTSTTESTRNEQTLASDLGIPKPKFLTNYNMPTCSHTESVLPKPQFLEYNLQAETQPNHLAESTIIEPLTCLPKPEGLSYELMSENKLNANKEAIYGTLSSMQMPESLENLAKLKPNALDAEKLTLKQSRAIGRGTNVKPVPDFEHGQCAIKSEPFCSLFEDIPKPYLLIQPIKQQSQMKSSTFLSNTLLKQETHGQTSRLIDNLPKPDMLSHDDLILNALKIKPERELEQSVPLQLQNMPKPELLNYEFSVLNNLNQTSNDKLSPNLTKTEIAPEKAASVKPSYLMDFFKTGDSTLPKPNMLKVETNNFLELVSNAEHLKQETEISSEIVQRTNETLVEISGNEPVRRHLSRLQLPRYSRAATDRLQPVQADWKATRIDSSSRKEPVLNAKPTDLSESIPKPQLLKYEGKVSNDNLQTDLTGAEYSQRKIVKFGSASFLMELPKPQLLRYEQPGTSRANTAKLSLKTKIDNDMSKSKIPNVHSTYSSESISKPELIQREKNISAEAMKRANKTSLGNKTLADKSVKVGQVAYLIVSSKHLDPTTQNSKTTKFNSNLSKTEAINVKPGYSLESIPKPQLLQYNGQISISVNNKITDKLPSDLNKVETNQEELVLIQQASYLLGLLNSNRASLQKSNLETDPSEQASAGVTYGLKSIPKPLLHKSEGQISKETVASTENTLKTDSTLRPHTLADLSKPQLLVSEIVSPKQTICARPSENATYCLKPDEIPKPQLLNYHAATVNQKINNNTDILNPQDLCYEILTSHYKNENIEPHAPSNIPKPYFLASEIPNANQKILGSLSGQNTQPIPYCLNSAEVSKPQLLNYHVTTLNQKINDNTDVIKPQGLCCKISTSNSTNENIETHAPSNIPKPHFLAPEIPNANEKFCKRLPEQNTTSPAPYCLSPTEIPRPQFLNCSATSLNQKINANTDIPKPEGLHYDMSTSKSTVETPKPDIPLDMPRSDFLVPEIPRNKSQNIWERFSRQNTPPVSHCLNPAEMPKPELFNYHMTTLNQSVARKPKSQVKSISSQDSARKKTEYASESRENKVDSFLPFNTKDIPKPQLLNYETYGVNTLDVSLGRAKAVDHQNVTNITADYFKTTLPNLMVSNTVEIRRATPMDKKKRHVNNRNVNQVVSIQSSKNIPKPNLLSYELHTSAKANKQLNNSKGIRTQQSSANLVQTLFATKDGTNFKPELKSLTSCMPSFLKQHPKLIASNTRCDKSKQVETKNVQTNVSKPHFLYNNSNDFSPAKDYFKLKRKSQKHFAFDSKTKDASRINKRPLELVKLYKDLEMTSEESVEQFLRKIRPKQLRKTKSEEIIFRKAFPPKNKQVNTVLSTILQKEQHIALRLALPDKLESTEKQISEVLKQYVEAETKLMKVSQKAFQKVEQRVTQILIKEGIRATRSEESFGRIRLQPRCKNSLSKLDKDNIIEAAKLIEVNDRTFEKFEQELDESRMAERSKLYLLVVALIAYMTEDEFVLFD